MLSKIQKKIALIKLNISSGQEYRELKQEYRELKQEMKALHKSVLKGQVCFLLPFLF